MTVALNLAAYDPSDIRPGWIALGVVLALAVATFLLWRSMNTQLRKIQAPTKAELAERGEGETDPDADASERQPDAPSTGSDNGTKP